MSAMLQISSTANIGVYADTITICLYLLYIFEWFVAILFDAMQLF